MLGKSKTASAQASGANASNKKAPISSHPLFAVVIAIWFAALLGVGSLILPVALFEGLFSATSISSVVPAAAAPLGFTARMLIAIAAAVSGAAAGVLIARKVAASQRSSSDRRLDANAEDHEARAYADDGDDRFFKQPISAHEELGSESLDEPIAETPSEVSNKAVSGPSYKGKRRSLAVTDESGPSEFLDLAPLPGGDVAFDDEDPMHHTGLLELGEFSNEHSDSDDGGDDVYVPNVFGRDPVSQPVEAVDFSGLDDNDGFRPIGEASSQASQPMAQPVPMQAEDLREDCAPMIGASFQAMNQRPFASIEEQSEVSSAPQTLRDLPVQDFASQIEQSPAPSFAVPEAQTEPTFMKQDFAPTAPSDMPLSELGLVELVDRFTKALQSKSAVSPLALSTPAIEAETVGSPVALAADAEINSPPSIFEEETETPKGAASPLIFRRVNSASSEDVAPDVPATTVPEEAPAVAAMMETAASVPAALQPLGFDDSDEEEDTSDFSGLSLSLQPDPRPVAGQPEQELQSAQFAEPVAETPAAFAPEAPPSAEQEPIAEDESYSSLLNMRSAMASTREFVRIEDDESTIPAVEPVVVFPGQDSQVAAPMVNEPSHEEEIKAGAQSAEGDMPAHRPFDGPSGAPVKAAGNAFPNSGETERALRDALEKLQRMSGAA